MSVCAALAFGIGCATDARPDSVDDDPQYSTSEVEQDIGHCLTSCDRQYPGCTPGGNQHPTRIQDCF